LIELIDRQKLTAFSLKTPRVVQDTTTFPINDIMDRVFGKVVSPAIVCVCDDSGYRDNKQNHHQKRGFHHVTKVVGYSSSGIRTNNNINDNDYLIVNYYYIFCEESKGR
jgi:hypothetical protein